MANQTTAREASRKPGERVYHAIAASSAIYKGSLVNCQHGNTPTSEGYAIPTFRNVASNLDAFLGVAYETVDNSAGADGAKSLQVYKTGTFRFAASTPDQTWVG